MLAWLPAGSLARVDLLYPDPWPKRRHWKRRFVQERSIADDRAHPARRAANSASSPTWPDYAAWTLRRLLRSPDFAWTAERADDWRLPWPGFTGTRYEAKAKREGRAALLSDFPEDGRPRTRHSTIAPALQGEPRNTPSLKNTRNGVVPEAPPSNARHLPFWQSVPPCAATASNSMKLG